MAGSTTNISIRMDSELKAQADALFNELGMNLSTAFNIFVRQSLREGRIPFSISLDAPNQETIAALMTKQMDSKYVYAFKSGHVTFESIEEIPWTLDGEYGGEHDEVVIENLNKELQIMVPSEEKIELEWEEENE